MSQPDFDIAVIGGGMVGAATACLLLREKFSVVLIEAREPPVFDPSNPVGLRVSALSPGSESILGHTGAWRMVAGRRHCPYRRMHVEEANGKKPAAFDFAAAEFGLERLGTIVENDSISQALWQVLEARKTAGDELEMERSRQLGLPFEDPVGDRTRRNTLRYGLRCRLFHALGLRASRSPQSGWLRSSGLIGWIHTWVAPAS